MVLHAHADEVDEHHERQGGGGGDGTRAGLHAGDDADDVVHHDEHEQSAQERQVTTPGLLAQNAHAHVVLEVLDHVLDGIGETAARHHGDALCEREHDDEQHDRGNDQPERVLRQA